MEPPLLEAVGGPRASAPPIPCGAGPAWQAARSSLCSIARAKPRCERFRARSALALCALARGPAPIPARAAWGILMNRVTARD
eukprot:5785867-Alexandrium_andersonii.AAC.1